MFTAPGNNGNIIQYIAQDFAFRCPLLRLALDRAQSKHNATTDCFLEFLFQSPAFVPSSRSLLDRGLRAFVEGDHVTAIHVLLPQIEAAVRNLVRSAGGPVYEVGRHGGMNLRNLDKLLIDQQLVAILSERVTLYLRILLTDQRGWNIRNLVSHGLVAPGGFEPAVADRVMHALLLLAFVREKPSDGSTPTDTEADSGD